jgi:uncharacterized protein (TIGR03083 family)
MTSASSRPVTELDKSEVLSGLFAAWDAVDGLMNELPEIRWQTPTPLPGWSVHAVLSHLIGTESSLLGIATPEADIDVSTLEHVRNDIGAMNERWVRHFSGDSGAALHARFRAVTNDRRKRLTDMCDEDWNALTPTPGGLDSYGRFMRIRVFDCWMHEQDIREALRQPPSDDDLDGPPARLALDEIAATMGYVVGKLGKAPDGSRVVFELTGPLARTIRVLVDGRGQVVDDFGGLAPTSAPIVSIRLDGLQFTRLVGGRPISAGRSEVIELGGQQDVAARIAEHLSFVI